MPVHSLYITNLNNFVLLSKIYNYDFDVDVFESTLVEHTKGYLNASATGPKTLIIKFVINWYF